MPHATLNGRDEGTELDAADLTQDTTRKWWRAPNVSMLRCIERTASSSHREIKPMKRVFLATALSLLASTATFAAEPGSTPSMSPSSTNTLMTTMPGDAVTVTNWYKQNVYDSSNNKIGEIVDVLVNKNGAVTAVMISVGGFLGMDTKDIAAPFQAIHVTMKDNKWWLVMNATKEALKTAPGYKYDKTSTTWVSDKS
jgi:sporulation protein YlmC with PRC-barrel domain